MSRTTAYMLATLLGGVAGAALGVMVAPHRGRLTRRKLSRRIADDRAALARSSHRAAFGLSEYLYEQFEESKRRLGRLSA